MAPATSLQEVIHVVETETEDPSPLGRLRAASGVVRRLADTADAALGYFVDQARHAGHSWSEIGEALGVSKQAAQQKHTDRPSPSADAPTFEWFTPRARRVVSCAEPVARDWGHDRTGTEHLLIALYEEPEGIACQILLDSGLSFDRVIAAAASRVARGPGAPEGSLPFTPAAKAVFSGARASALELCHNYIGTEHLLLGLERADGVAKEVLQEAGLSGDVLAHKLTERLASYDQARRTQPRSRSAMKSPAAKRAPRPRQTSA